MQPLTVARGQRAKREPTHGTAEDDYQPPTIPWNSIAARRTQSDPLARRLSRIRHLSGTAASVAIDTARATGHGSSCGA